MITEIEQNTLDIDWFFIFNGNIAFVASGGGKLPQSVAKSWEKNKILSLFFRSLPEISEVVINPDLCNVVTSPIDDCYLADFVEMTKKGLFSFDKTVLNDFSESSYHLVAKPVNPLNINQLPIQILEAISESEYFGHLNSKIDVNLVR